MSVKQIQFTVNGRPVTIETDPQRPLLDVLREDLGLTGTKYGCGERRCGACSVLADDRRVFSCSTPVADMAGKHITTIEALADDDQLHRVQKAFLDEGAFQCGYCTPGMILTAVALLRVHPHPTDQQIVSWMNGNLCRCHGYSRIVRAVRRAAYGARGESRS